MGKVIVVDDEPFLRSALRRLLTRMGGHQVVFEAGNGREALEFFRSGGDAEIVISDIDMPEMDGFEMVHCLRAMGLTIPVILASGDAENNGGPAKAMVLSGEIQGFFAKPWNVGELLSLTRQLLNDPGAAPTKTE